MNYNANIHVFLKGNVIKIVFVVVFEKKDAL